MLIKMEKEDERHVSTPNWASLACQVPVRPSDRRQELLVPLTEF